jgi:hypothetical protein
VSVFQFVLPVIILHSSKKKNGHIENPGNSLHLQDPFQTNTNASKTFIHEKNHFSVNDYEHRIFFGLQTGQRGEESFFHQIPDSFPGSSV